MGRADQEKARFAHIDSLRAVAALLVVTHASEILAPGSLLRDIAVDYSFGRNLPHGVVLYTLRTAFDRGWPGAGLRWRRPC